MAYDKKVDGNRGHRWDFEFRMLRIYRGSWVMYKDFQGYIRISGAWGVGLGFRDVWSQTALIAETTAIFCNPHVSL